MGPAVPAAPTAAPGRRREPCGAGPGAGPSQLLLAPGEGVVPPSSWDEPTKQD